MAEWLNKESCGDGFVRVWRGVEYDWLELWSGEFDGDSDNFVDYGIFMFVVLEALSALSCVCRTEGEGKDNIESVRTNNKTTSYLSQVTFSETVQLNASAENHVYIRIGKWA